MPKSKIKRLGKLRPLVAKPNDVFTLSMLEETKLNLIKQTNFSTVAMLGLKCNAGVCIAKASRVGSTTYNIIIDTVHPENIEEINRDNVALFRLFATRLLDVCDEIEAGGDGK